MMRTFQRLFLWIASLYLLTACSFFKSQSSNLNYLIHAQNGIISMHSKKSDTGTLVLKGVWAYVDFFAAAPSHLAGKEPLRDFINDWDDKGIKKFNRDSANAAIVPAVGAEKNAFISIPVILENPSFNASNNELTFTIRSINEEPFTIQNLGETTLYINGAKIFIRN